MAPIIEQIIRFISAPEGNLIYSVVLGLVAFGALLSCLYAKGNQETPSGKRMQLGLLILLLAQLLLFSVNWLVWQEVIDGHVYLPPLDRTLALFSLVLIIWLWAFPKPNSMADTLVAVVEIVIVVLGISGMVLWLRQSSNISFNTSTLGGYAYYSGLGFLAIGVILLLWRRPSYWGYAILMLVILLGGYLAQSFTVQEAADYSWFVHLGEMVAFTLLLALPIRLVKLRQDGESADKVTTSQLVSPLVGAKLIQSGMRLSAEISPQRYYQELTRIVAQLMNADFCLLMMPPKTGEQLIVPVGYSRQQDQMIDGFTADGHKMPSLVEAVKSGKSLQLTSSDLDPEVQTLAAELGMKRPTQLLMVPFHPKGTSAAMGIAVLSNVLAPSWNEESALQLKEISEILVSNVGQYSTGANRQAAQAEIMKELQQAQAYTDQVRLEYAQLKAKYNSISGRVSGTASEVESIAVLAESQKSLQDTVRRLEARNLELENLVAKGKPSMEEVEQLGQELRSALADLARVPSTLSKSDQRMLEQQLSAVKRLDEMQPIELVTSIAQEIRHPLSSIVGYTDLLLGESVGILGAVQRNFLERVKASTERLGILLNELVQVVTIDGGKVDQTQVSVDSAAIIDEAIGNIKAQINEKRITMQVDLPDKLPAIRANKDALQQILANLLENACLVTPVEGKIRLSARVEQRENEQKYMLISVMDQGGGIDKMDLTRVFSRRYKMENPLIEGIGDSGVGLSIVKSLVELHKGRVWVDTQLGVGSTFSILLPLAEDRTNQVNPTISTG